MVTGGTGGGWYILKIEIYFWDVRKNPIIKTLTNGFDLAVVIFKEGKMKCKKLIVLYLKKDNSRVLFTVPFLYFEISR